MARQSSDRRYHWLNGTVLGIGLASRNRRVDSISTEPCQVGTLSSRNP